MVEVIEGAVLRKRMVRLSSKFHRRMTGDPRLAGIAAKLDGIEKTLGDILRDFSVGESPAKEVSKKVAKKAAVKKEA